MNLFVYGTLAAGESNEHILKGVEGFWQEASVTGKLYACGWGAVNVLRHLFMNYRKQAASDRLSTI